MKNQGKYHVTSSFCEHNWHNKCNHLILHFNLYIPWGNLSYGDKLNSISRFLRFTEILALKLPFYVSHAARCSVSTAATSGQRQACCQFAGNCTTEKMSSSNLWAWDSPAPRDSGTTLASVRELIPPNLALNREEDQTALHCFTLVPRNENSYRLSCLLPQFPPHFQGFFSCKVNRNMLLFNEMCFTTLRIPS